MSVTEAQADRAIVTLKRAIDAAENSNQAGEDAVVAMAAGPELLEALITAEALFQHTFAMGGTVHNRMKAAIAKATGQEGGAL